MHECHASNTLYPHPGHHPWFFNRDNSLFSSLRNLLWKSSFGGWITATPARWLFPSTPPEKHLSHPWVWPPRFENQGERASHKRLPNLPKHNLTFQLCSFRVGRALRSRQDHGNFLVTWALTSVNFGLGERTWWGWVTLWETELRSPTPKDVSGSVNDSCGPKLSG